MIKKAPRCLCIVARLAAVGALGLAAVLLGPGTAHAAVASSVQSGTVANAANGTQIVTISGVDPAKSFLIFETRHNSNRPVASEVRGRIPIACTNPCTTIEFVRVTNEGAPATINIQWYVVTFASGVTVQRGEIGQTGTTINVGAPEGFAGVAAVNQAFVLWSKTPDAVDTTWDGNDTVLGEIITTTNLQFRADGIQATHMITWQVVEFTDAADINVQKGSILPGMTTAQLSVTATLGTAVDVNKTFVLVGFRTSGSGAANIGAVMLQTQLTNSTTITIDRSTVGAPAVAITEIYWQAIELKDDSIVVHGSSNFAAGVAQATVPMVPHVNVSRAIAFGSVQNGGGQNLGRSPYVGDDILGVGSATMALSATQLTLDRNNTANTADVGWFVVEFDQGDARVLTGSYRGDGAASQPISVGFVPDFVIVKGGDQTGVNAETGVFRSSTMGGTTSKPAMGAEALTGNLIISIDATGDGGFTVGSHARVNSNACTNGCLYYWTAFKAGPGKMEVGTYVGTGTSSPVNTITGVGFSPELVFIMSEGATEALHISSVSTMAKTFNDLEYASVAALSTDGFTVPTGGALTNGSGTTYHYVAWNAVPGEMVVGTYAGESALPAGQNITSVGFQSEYLFVQRQGAGFQAQGRTASLAQSNADGTLFFFPFGYGIGRISALLSNGFSVSDQSNVNGSGGTFSYYAWKRESQPMIVTGDYDGTGVAKSITEVGFAPDVVIVKQFTGATQRIGVIRTSTMTNGKRMTGATALLANSITSLDASGFTLGTSLVVNTSGVIHHFIAFKAAAGTMKVGRYQGNDTSTVITNMGFSPELVFILPEGLQTPVHYSSANTAEFYDFATSAGTAAVGVIALNADGFTVSTANTSVNANTVWYNYVAWNEIPGEIDIGSYVGNSTGALNNDNRNIPGVGFEPEYVIVKSINATATVHHTGSLGRSTDTSLYFSGTISAGNLIQALVPDGFQVGDAGAPNLVNATGVTYVYYAWKRPQASAFLTAVRLTAFDATRYDRGVLLEWRTGDEIDNLGFHVYREVDGRRTRVTRSIVAGSGLMAGQGTAVTAEQRYAVWDLDSASANQSAVYWLEDLDFNGTSTWHGPVTPVQGRLEAPPNVTSSAALHELGKGKGQKRRKVFLERGGRLERRGKAGARKAVVSAAEMQWALAAQGAVKIGVDHPGWYRVTQPELVAAGLSPRANARTLRLFVDGIEQAMMVTGEADGRFDPADAIEFYGTGVDTPYTDTRAYWLVADSRPGRRMTVHSRGGLRAPAINRESFDFTLQQKERSIYFAALRNGDEENWFGALVSEEPADLVFDLSNVDATTGDAAELEITLQGVTDNPGVDPDHLVAILVNGTEIGELRFDGQALGVQSFAIPPGILGEGANTVTVVARGGEADISLVDLVRVRYAHAYRADADLLRFTADGPGTITVGGFASSAIRVIDTTDALAAEELRGTVAQEAGLWAVTVRVPGGGPRTLLAFTDSTIAAPAFVRANRPSRWHAAANAADYLAVVHAEFADAVGPLLERRKQQGLSTARIDIEDVYDEFSFGEKTPQALRDFVRHARANWKRFPRFLLLVGDATIDPRDYAGFGDADFVPTKQVPLDHVALETASDDWFVDVDDDGLPDVAVGRLPVRTLDQAKGIVAKTIGYEGEGDAPWMKDVVFVADHDEAQESSPFETESRRLEALLPQGYRGHELFASQLGADVLRQALASQVADGRLIVNYSGHGSTQLWGVHGDLLGPDEVNTWTNARLPFVVAMNCLNGAFQGIYDEESLAETLLRAPRGGAVAVWASSGVTDTYTQAVVAQELYRLIFQGTGLTVGEATAAAKRVVSNRDIRRAWIFFGDPAMRLRGVTPAAAQPTEMSSTLVLTSASSTFAPEDSTEDPSALVKEALYDRVRLADFTGDGRDDLWFYARENGAWRALFSDAGPRVQAAGQWVPGLQISAARLNDDAAADLVFYRPATGEWLEALNAGPGRFTLRASGTALADQQLLLADFTGDGRDDRLMYDPRTGTVAVTTHDKTGDVIEPRRTWLAGARLHAGDFNGDGLADFVGYDALTGSGFLALRTKNDFAVVDTQWGAGWAVTSARLSDPRRSDLVFYDPKSGSVRLAVSDGRDSFTYRDQVWASGLTLQAADLNADGRDDLFGYSPQSGVWLTTTFSRRGVSESIGQWTIGWHVAIGDLDGDRRADIVLYEPVTGLGFRCLTPSEGVFECRPEQWAPDSALIGSHR